MNTAVAELREITKTFGKKTVIDRLSLQIEAGRIYAVTGKSGSGKSTLLNIIGGIEKASAGDVILFGRENPARGGVRLQKLLRYRISFLFQNYALSDNDTVRYNLLMALRYSRVKNKKQAVADALFAVDLAGYEEQKIYTLSGGEQQRTAIARLLLKPTELVLADEPTGNLDVANRDVVFGLLQKLRREGKTVVVATHDTELAGRCDAVIRLDG